MYSHQTSVAMIKTSKAHYHLSIFALGKQM